MERLQLLACSSSTPAQRSPKTGFLQEPNLLSSSTSRPRAYQSAIRTLTYAMSTRSAPAGHVC